VQIVYGKVFRLPNLKLKIELIITWLLATILVIFIKGYSFIHSDQLQYFIYSFKLAQPGFLANDWFTTNTTPYHIFYTYFLVFLLKFGSFKINVFISFIIFTFLLVLSLWYLIKTLLPDKHYYVFPYVLFFIMLSNNLYLGDSTMKTSVLLAQDMAFPLLILAFTKSF